MKNSIITMVRIKYYFSMIITSLCASIALRKLLWLFSLTETSYEYSKHFTIVSILLVSLLFLCSILNFKYANNLFKSYQIFCIFLILFWTVNTFPSLSTWEICVNLFITIQSIYFYFKLRKLNLKKQEIS